MAGSEIYLHIKYICYMKKIDRPYALHNLWFNFLLKFLQVSVRQVLSRATFCKHIMLMLLVTLELK